jgi:hypothetical protein
MAPGTTHGKATTEMMIGNQVAQSIAMNLVCCPGAAGRFDRLNKSRIK